MTTLKTSVIALQNASFLIERSINKKTRTELTSAKIKDLDDLITTLATIEGKLRASGLR